MLHRVALAALTPVLFALAGPASAEEVFVPARYQEALEAAHVAGADDHVITVRKITSAVEDVNTGKVTVGSVTQVLDCKTGSLVSQSRCDPCEYNVAEWPGRPLDVWFAEESWPLGAEVTKRKAEMRMAHFARYFKLEREGGADHAGMRYAFWRFDGRRAVSAAPTPPAEPEPKPEAAPPPPPEPKFGPVEKIEIFTGDTRPDEAFTPPGEDRLSLRAVAWATPEGGTVASQVDAFKPMWSTSCGSISSASAKEIVFTLSPGVDACKVFLFEARTGKEDTLLVRRGKKTPAVRLAITFEGGREADGVALTGTARNVELEAHAFDPAGTEIAFTPEWSVEGGKVEFLDGDTHRRLRVYVDPGVDQATVRARDPKSGAEDSFLIRLQN